MKKKKLKKEIKKLRKDIAVILHDGREAFANQSDRINTLGDKYTKLREDVTDLAKRRNIDMDTIRDACYKANMNRHAIDDIYKKLEILGLRTGTDYTQFKPLVDTNKGPDAVFVTEEETKSEDLNTTNCCDNCKFYKEAVSEYGNIFHKCKRPDIQQGPKAWINTKPTDFCSRYERRTSKR